MKHAYLNEIPKNRQMIGSFAGYNHNPRIEDNEFFDMQNMSGDLFPLLAPRALRGRVRQMTKPNGLFAHNALAWVDGTEFWYNGARVEGFEIEDSKKTFVSIGAYIVIFPDKMYYNTEDGTFGSLEQTIALSSVTVAPCQLDGAEITPTVSASAPEPAVDGDLWVDTSVTPHVLRTYTAGEWRSVQTTYVKIIGEGISGFSEYDAVTIDGMPNETLNGTFVVYRIAENSIVISAMIDQAETVSGNIFIKRNVPDMDYVTENENRLWGCSSSTHEIYACVQGDPKNWNRFLGISTDSYRVTVGSTGDFTGAITHLGYVMFFKEDVIHRIYGSKPSNYQLTNVNCRGIEKGSEKSMVIVNETLYYKSRQDVCAFSGSLPASISQALGNVKYKNASAGQVGSKYYISMTDETGVDHLFVYDEVRGLWHREDNVKAEYFASFNDELYFIDERDRCLYSVSGRLNDTYTDAEAETEARVSSQAITGDIGLDSPDHKYVSKIQVRMVVDAGARIEVYVQYDKETEAWTKKYEIAPTMKTSCYIPIIPRRCDTMRMKIVGEGMYKIYSICKTIENGSEML